VARDVFGAIDEALGVALSRLMFEGPEAELTATQNTQPAILAHSAAVFAVVGEKAGEAVAARGIRSRVLGTTSRRLRWHRPKRRNWCGGAAS